MPREKNSNVPNRVTLELHYSGYEEDVETAAPTKDIIIEEFPSVFEVGSGNEKSRKTKCNKGKVINPNPLLLFSPSYQALLKRK